MSTYRFNARTISRTDGGSVVAAAACGSGTRLYETNGRRHDHRSRPGVEHAEILAPPGAPGWVYNRQRLWNAVESAERRKEAHLARELEIALPVELPPDEQIELARQYVRWEFVSRGMIADLAIHREDVHHPRLHVLLSTRMISSAGFGIQEPTWNESGSVSAWRRDWAEIANAYLARCVA